MHVQDFQSDRLLDEAINIALDVLPILGVRIARKPNSFAILYELIKYKATTFGKPIAALADSREMTDPAKLEAMRIITSVGTSAYTAQPELLAMLVLKAVNLSIRYGNAPSTAFSYAGFGMILCGGMGAINSGYQFGKLALKLLERMNINDQRCRTEYVYYAYIRHWKKSISESLQPLLLARLAGLETGDLDFAAQCTLNYCQHLCHSGRKLDQYVEKAKTYLPFIMQLKQEITSSMMNILHQYALNLREKSAVPWDMSGRYFDEVQMLPLLHEEDNQATLFIFYAHKLILCYHFQQFKAAQDNAALARKFQDAGTGDIMYPLFYFYETLSLLADLTDMSRAQKRRCFLRIYFNIRKMKKWASHAPANFTHKYYLMKAELARTRGKNEAAARDYSLAIQQAKENGFLHEEALANELTGRFHLSVCDKPRARFYFEQAINGYVYWGSPVKAQFLRDRYANMLESQRSPINASAGHRSGRQDILTETLRELADTRQLEKILKTVMLAATDFAGAWKGVLVLKYENEYRIAVRCSKATSSAAIIESWPLQSVEPAHPAALPLSVIRSVIESKAHLRIFNITGNKSFKNDAYIREMRPDSILCLPLLHHKVLSGVLYLENMESTNTMSPNFVQILADFCSHAAVYIENARVNLKLEQIDAVKIKSLSRVPDKFSKLKNLDEGEIHTIKECIEKIMIEDKAFLDKDLKAADLTAKLNTAIGLDLSLTKEQISEFLNKRFGKSFKNFVNGYRIVEAQAYLIHRNKKSIPVIGELVGFGSQAAYYRVFEKHCGLTPLQYRLKHGRK